jgi:lipoyl(octanoyl) transferase
MMKVVNLDQQDYLTTWEKMKRFNAERKPNTEDELWIVEHPSVFTEGISRKPEHFLLETGIQYLTIQQCQQQVRIQDWAAKFVTST